MQVVWRQGGAERHQHRVRQRQDEPYHRTERQRQDGADEEPGGTAHADKRRGALRRSRLRDDDQEGEGDDATRNGNDIPERRPLRLATGAGERDVPTRHVFKHELPRACSPRTGMPRQSEPRGCGEEIPRRDFGWYAEACGDSQSDSAEP